MTDNTNANPDQEIKSEGSSLSSLQHVTFQCPVDHHGTNVQIVGLRGGDSNVLAKESKSLPPVLLVHDLGEEIGVYGHVGEAFGLKGYHVYGYDFRGHGESGGALSHITQVKQLVNDLLQVVALVRAEEQGRLPIVMAQGMSALIAVSFLKKFGHLISGLVLVAPCFRLRVAMSWFKNMFIRSFAEIVPGIKIPKGLAPNLFCSVKFDDEKSGVSSRKSKIIERLSSPIIPQIPASLVNDLIGIVQDGMKPFFSVTSPCLVFAPRDDKICVFEELIKEVEKRSMNNAKIEILEGKGHSFLLEAQTEDLFKLIDKITEWVKGLPVKDKWSIQHIKRERKLDHRPAQNEDFRNIDQQNKDQQIFDQQKTNQHRSPLDET